MSASFTPPTSRGGSATPAVMKTPPPNVNVSSPYSSSASSSSIVVVIIIISSAVIVSASIYLLLRFLTKRFHGSFRTSSAADDVVRLSNRNSSHQQKGHVAYNHLLESLPLFTFNSVTPPDRAGGDCAVCLSKFEPRDQLRLLPLCCHAFHAACIDAWIVSNQTCPLCRSIVIPCSSAALDKFISTENHGIINADNSLSDANGNRNGNSGSFRIEIGSISRRRDGEVELAEGARRRSYSLGSFEYIVRDNGYEVPVGFTSHRRGFSGFASNDKPSSVVIPVPEPPREVLAAEASGGRNWVREYASRLASVSFSSRTMSFRNSGRFFGGSGRRNQAVVVPEDLEAHRVGEDISELFRWLSGI